jgi:AcrR family transcriptional regulator
LAAARERFAESGYEAATIRAIAADANIDPSMVMRYFGNNDQLFAAAAEFDLRFPDLFEVDPAELGHALVSHFLKRWEDDEALVVLLRSFHHQYRSGATHDGHLRGTAVTRYRQVRTRRRAASGRPDRHPGTRNGAVPVRLAVTARGRDELL